METQIKVNNLTKKYNDTVAINSINMSAHKGEFLTIVGPSGCGKSTLLKSIAGLEKPNSGEIFIEDKMIFSATNKVNLPPEKREVALVFQNYALWPHFNVYKNVAYPLVIRKTPKKIIHTKVHQHLCLVRLEGKEERYPHELSGGEQQRVALARALIMSPKLLLLDEPLSNLDAKLREIMQVELKRIQRTLNLTVIHVTHDQAEAMELADRIIVMNNSQIAQVGTAQEIYTNPSSCFIANFIGKTNLIYKNGGNPAHKSSTRLFEEIISIKTLNATSCSALSIRPEEIKLNSSHGEFKGTVLHIVYHGATTNYIISYAGAELVVQTKSDLGLKEGDTIYFSIGRVTVF